MTEEPRERRSSGLLGWLVLGSWFGLADGAIAVLWRQSTAGSWIDRSITLGASIVAHTLLLALFALALRLPLRLVARFVKWNRPNQHRAIVVASWVGAIVFLALEDLDAKDLLPLPFGAGMLLLCLACAAIAGVLLVWRPAANLTVNWTSSRNSFLAVLAASAIRGDRFRGTTDSTQQRGTRISHGENSVILRPWCYMLYDGGKKMSEDIKRD